MKWRSPVLGRPHRVLLGYIIMCICLIYLSSLKIFFIGEFHPFKFSVLIDIFEFNSNILLFSVCSLFSLSYNLLE